MLSGFPTEFRWDGNSSESIVFYEDLGLLTDAILEAGTKPRIDITGNIHGCCTDKVVPVSLLVPALSYFMGVEDTNHEVRV